MILPGKNVIALAAALPVETQPVVERLSAERIQADRSITAYAAPFGLASVMLTCSGPGPANAAAAMDWLCGRYRVNHVIAFGLAGALRRGLATGTVVIPSAVTRAGALADAIALDVPPCPPGWNGSVRHGGLAVEVARPYGPAQKRTIEHTNALTVDMESFTIARAARERGVSVSVIRVVCDEFDFEFGGLAPRGAGDPGDAAFHWFDPKAKRAFVKLARAAADRNASFLKAALPEILKSHVCA